MSRSRRIWTLAALPAALLVLAAAWANRHPEIPSAVPAEASQFDSDLVDLGESLAGIGACEVCHTSQGGAPFAGGRALPTPFGVIYSTNITPDERTGIGGWSESAFRRLHDSMPAVASYVVTHAHKRRALVKLNARECFHLFKLRTQRQAHFTIQQVSEAALKLAVETHPWLFRHLSLRDFPAWWPFS